MHYFTKFDSETSIAELLELFQLGAIIEQYANNLLIKYRQTWKLDNPKYGQEERAIRIDDRGMPEHLLSSILMQMGIDNAVAIACLPASLIVYCNPGEVFYQIIGKQNITHLWAGDVNADMRYTPSASGANLVFFQSNRSELNSLWASFFSGVPGQDIQQRSKMLMDAIDTPKDQTPVLLQLNIALVFSFTPADKEPITAMTFKETRFGSHTPRIDHEFLNRLRQGAARKALLTTSSYPNSINLSSMHISLPPTGEGINVLQQPNAFPKLQYTQLLKKTSGKRRVNDNCILGVYSPNKRPLEIEDFQTLEEEEASLQKLTADFANTSISLFRSQIGRRF
uniref:Anti_prolifrtn domain-containing protein n=1 Tax=Syphacia muris TaxID=451379 RepID=A0A0N5AHX0_9BILA